MEQQEKTTFKGKCFGKLIKKGNEYATYGNYYHTILVGSNFKSISLVVNEELYHQLPSNDETDKKWFEISFASTAEQIGHLQDGKEVRFFMPEVTELKEISADQCLTGETNKKGYPVENSDWINISFKNALLFVDKEAGENGINVKNFVDLRFRSFLNTIGKLVINSVATPSPALESGKICSVDFKAVIYNKYWRTDMGGKRPRPNLLLTQIDNIFETNITQYVPKDEVSSIKI